MRVRFLLCSLVIWICPATQLHAQAPSHDLQLTIGFDQPVSENPTPFVFVKGDLAGIAPGTVVIPDEPNDVAVEIGVAQLSPAPLYSFALGPKNLAEGTVEVTLSSFEFGAPKGEGVWSGLGLNPNIRKLIKLERKSSDAYSISLPAEVFQGLAKYWNARISRLPKDRNWFGTVAQSQNASTKAGFDHLTFDKGKDQAVLLAYKRDQTWSGAYATTAGMSGVLRGYDLPTEQWTIVSTPTGATIYTDAGSQGSTTSTISIAKTGSFFVVLKKDGFQQCPSRDCQRQNTNGGVTLICKLKKLR